MRSTSQRTGSRKRGQHDLLRRKRYTTDHRAAFHVQGQFARRHLQRGPRALAPQRGELPALQALHENAQSRAIPHQILQALRLRLANRYRSPQSGSRPIPLCTRPNSPLYPLRRSAGFGYANTRTDRGSAIIPGVPARRGRSPGPAPPTSSHAARSTAPPSEFRKFERAFRRIFR